MDNQKVLLKNTEPEIKVISDKKLIGKPLKMTIANNLTFELWRGFMPRLKEIKNRATTDLISMQVYNPQLHFSSFNEHTLFTKWAAAEVSSFDYVPDDMETFLLKGGKYAVFLYKGAASQAAATFNYIYNIWLPASQYELDNRPHFEVLGDKYKNNYPDSEEEIWIPIKMKEK